MAYPYITETQLRDRVGATTLDRITDDNDDGTGDASVIAQVRADASAEVAGALGPAYDLDAVALNTPPRVVSLTLDVAHALLAQRYPEVVLRDWEPLYKAVERKLERVRKGQDNLGVTVPPEPGALHGGEVYSGDPDDDDPIPHTFLNGTGIF
jgi:phage gp36-like protein